MKIDLMSPSVVLKVCLSVIVFIGAEAFNASSLEWDVSPNPLAAGGEASVEWATSLLTGMLVFHVKVDERSVAVVNYTQTGSVNGLTLVPLATEGSHNISLNVLHNTCPKVNISSLHLGTGSSSSFADLTTNVVEGGTANASCEAWYNSSRKVVAFTPLNASEVTVSATADVHIPPGNTSLTFHLTGRPVSLYSSSYPLWVLVDWGESVLNLGSLSNYSTNVTGATHSIYHINVSTASDVTLSSHHQYLTPGIFNCSVKLANPIFSVTKSLNITVRKRAKVGRLVFLSSSGEPLPTTKSPSTPLLTTPGAEISISSNSSELVTATSWTLLLPDSNLTQTSLPFRTSFPQEGNYVIGLQADGPQGLALPEFTTLAVRRPLAAPLMVVEPPLIRAGQQVALGAMVPEIFGSCLTLDLGDGFPLLGWRGEEGCDVTTLGSVQWLSETLADRVTFLHRTSLSASEVQAVITLHTLEGALNSSADARVLPPGACNTLKASVLSATDEASPMVVRRTETVKLQATVLPDCKEAAQNSVEWTVVPVSPPPEGAEAEFRKVLLLAVGVDTWPNSSLLYDRDTGLNNSLALPAVNTSQESLVVAPYVLPYGLYSVMVYYNVSQQGTNATDVSWSAAKAYTTIKVVPNDLKVGVVRGGASMIRRGTVYLNASTASSDIDALDNKLALYEWWCKKEEEAWPADDQLEQGPQTLPATDMGGCFGRGPGKLPPQPGNGELLHLANTKFFGIPRKVVIRVKGHSVDGRSSTAESLVEVVPGEPPVVVMGCVPPHACYSLPGGEFFVSPTKLILQADCELVPWITPPEGSNCPPGISFEWELYGLPNATAIDAKELLQVADTNTTIGLTQRSLVLLDTFWTTFNHYQHFQAVVKGRRADEAYPGYVSATIVVNMPPVNGTCYIVLDPSANVTAGGVSTTDQQTAYSTSNVVITVLTSEETGTRDSTVGQGTNITTATAAGSSTDSSTGGESTSMSDNSTTSSYGSSSSVSTTSTPESASTSKSTSTISTQTPTSSATLHTSTITSTTTKTSLNTASLFGNGGGIFGFENYLLEEKNQRSNATATTVDSRISVGQVEGASTPASVQTTASLLTTLNIIGNGIVGGWGNFLGSTSSSTASGSTSSSTASGSTSSSTASGSTSSSTASGSTSSSTASGSTSSSTASGSTSSSAASGSTSSSTASGSPSSSTTKSSIPSSTVGSSTSTITGSVSSSSSTIGIVTTTKKPQTPLAIDQVKLVGGGAGGMWDAFMMASTQLLYNQETTSKVTSSATTSTTTASTATTSQVVTPVNLNNIFGSSGGIGQFGLARLSSDSETLSGPKRIQRNADYRLGSEKVFDKSFPLENENTTNTANAAVAGNNTESLNFTQTVSSVDSTFSQQSATSNASNGPDHEMFPRIKALVEPVMLECSGWVDPEGGNIVKYTYYGLSSEQKNLPLTFGSESRVSVILPAASNLSLWARVEDEHGSVAEYHVAVLDTALPTVQEVQAYEDSGVRDGAVAAMQVALVGQLLQAEGSLQGRQLPGAQEGPLTEEEVLAAQQKALSKNTKMVAAVDSFSTSSMDDVVQVTGILGAVAYPLPPDAEEAAVSSMVALASAVSPTASARQVAEMADTATSVVASLVKGVNENVLLSNKTIVQNISYILSECFSDDLCWVSLGRCFRVIKDAASDQRLLLNQTLDPASNQTLGRFPSNQHGFLIANQTSRILTSNITDRPENLTTDILRNQTTDIPQNQTTDLQNHITGLSLNLPLNQTSQMFTNETTTTNVVWTASYPDPLPTTEEMADYPEFQFVYSLMAGDEVNITMANNCSVLRALDCALKYWDLNKTESLFGIKFDSEKATDLQGDANCTSYLDSVFIVDPDASKANEKVEAALGVVNSVQAPLLGAAVVGDEPARVAAGDVALAVGMFDAGELQGRQVEVGGAVYEFPSYCAIMGQQADCIPEGVQISLGIKMARWTSQVYGFGGNTDTLSDGSATVQLSLVDANLQPIDVHHSLEDFIMYIPIESSSLPEPTCVEAVPNANRTELLNVHTLRPQAPRIGILIQMMPKDTSSGNTSHVIDTTTTAAPEDMLDDFGVYDDEPIHTVWTSDVWVVTWGTEMPGNDTAPDYYFLLDQDFLFNNDSGYYELFLDSAWLAETMPADTGAEFVKEYFLGVAKVNMTAVEEYFMYQDYSSSNDSSNSSIEVSDAHDNVKSVFESLMGSPSNASLALLLPVDEDYNITTSFSSCLFFDSKALAWSSEGCKVAGGNSTTTVCACNHLTSFGTGFIPMPNPIDFSYVFANAGFAENLTIYLTIIISLSLYIIGLIYARIMDKRDLQKIGATPLPENRPEDTYVYDIYVFTGFQPNSGTKSNVSFLLTGDWDDSDVRQLKDDQRSILGTGAQDHFVMTTPRPLGPLQYLRIWHDNSGKGSKASWLFSHMVVRDLQTGEEWQFICNEWLAVEEGDGMIDRLVPVAGDEQLHDINHVLGKKVQRAIQDDHLWFSVFMRPPRSRFTRVQRLTSCMALVYLSMLTNAMFYNVVPESSSSINMGFARIAPAALAVGFMTNLIVFPPSFAIVYFFRKAQPKQEKPSRVKEALAKTEREKRDYLEELLGLVATKSSLNYADSVPMKSKSRPLKPKLAFQTSVEEANIATAQEQADEQKRKRRRRLPWYFRLVAWALCVICIVVSVFFLWAYGIMFGNAKTTQWLTALLSSLFSSVLVTQPIKIYLTAILLSWILRRPLDLHDDYDDDETYHDLDNDQELLHSASDGVTQERPRKVGRLVGSGISPEALAAAKQRRLNQVAMNSLLMEIAIYLAFVTIIGTISYGSTDYGIFLQNKHFKNQLAHPLDSDNVMQFFEIATREDYYEWLRSCLVPFLHDDSQYNGAPPDPLSAGTMHDKVSFVLGQPLLRQIRNRRDACMVPEIMTPAIKNCSGTATGKHEDESNYGFGWDDSTTHNKYFKFRTSLSVFGVPYTGNLGEYGGGGYFAELRKPLSTSLDIVDTLQNNTWIDRYTRAIFAEISIYNAQINMFGVVLLVAEQVPGGGMVTTFRYQGLNLLRYHGGAGVVLLVCEILFVLFIVFFTRREYGIMKKDGCKKYFSTFWNFLEIIVIILAFVSIIFYLIKTAYTYWLLDLLTETKGKRNIRMQSLAVFDKTLSQIIAFMLFIATVKMLRLLRFNKRIGYLSATLILAGPEIIAFFSLLLLTVVSFVTLFFTLAQTTSHDFSTFIMAIETSVLIIDQKYEDLNQASPLVGSVAYFAYAFIMYFVVFPFLIAIVCSAFSIVKADLSKQPNDYEVVEYMMSVAGAIFNRFTPRTSAKQKSEQSASSNLDCANKKLDGAIRQIQRNSKTFQSPFW